MEVAGPLGTPLGLVQGPHPVKTLEPRRFSRVASGFSNYDADFRLPLVLALGSPNFNSSCEGKLGVVLESLQGQRDLIEACVQDLIFLSREDRDLGLPFQTPPGSQASPRGEAEDSAFLSSRDTDLLEPNESPREGKGYPFQYSGLENSMNCPWGHKELDTTE